MTTRLFLRSVPNMTHSRKPNLRVFFTGLQNLQSGSEPLKVEVRLFEKLFNSENPAELGENWLGDLNPHSKVVIRDAYAVSSLGHAAVGDSFQFERLGYFVVDKDSTPGKPVFNRTVTLQDSYAKEGK